jgi:hypothetical protein
MVKAIVDTPSNRIDSHFQATSKSLRVVLNQLLRIEHDRIKKYDPLVTAHQQFQEWP